VEGSEKAYLPDDIGVAGVASPHLGCGSSAGMGRWCAYAFDRGMRLLSKADFEARDTLFFGSIIGQTTRESTGWPKSIWPSFRDASLTALTRTSNLSYPGLWKTPT
jgi:hypothetical protein